MASLVVSHCLTVRLLFDEMDTDSNHEVTKHEFDSWVAAKQDRALVFIPGAKDNLQTACITFRYWMWRVDEDENDVLDLDEFVAAYTKAVVAAGGTWSCAPNDGWMTDRVITAEMAGHAAVLMFGQVASRSSNTRTKDEYYNFVETEPGQAKIFIPGFADATTTATRRVAANRFRMWADLDEVLSVEDFKVRYITSVLSMIWDGYTEEETVEVKPANSSLPTCPGVVGAPTPRDASLGLGESVKAIHSMRVQERMPRVDNNAAENRVCCVACASGGCNLM